MGSKSLISDRFIAQLKNQGIRVNHKSQKKILNCLYSYQIIYLGQERLFVKYG